MFEEDKQVIIKSTEGNMELRENELKKLKETQSNFESLFNEEIHNKLVNEGSKRLSFKAIQAALMIYIYQDEPIFQIGFRLLNSLIEIDECLTNWRTRHAMVNK